MYWSQWRCHKDALYTVGAGVCYLCCCSLIYGRVHSGGTSSTWFCDTVPVVSWSLFTSGLHCVFLRCVMSTSPPFYRESFRYRSSRSSTHEVSVEPLVCLGTGSFSRSRSAWHWDMRCIAWWCVPVTKGSPGVLRTTQSMKIFFGTVVTLLCLFYVICIP